MSDEDVGYREVVAPFDEIIEIIAQLTAPKYFFLNTSLLADVAHGLQQTIFDHCQTIEEDVIRLITPAQSKIFIVAMFADMVHRLENVLAPPSVEPWADEWTRDLAQRAAIPEPLHPHMQRPLENDSEPSPFFLRIIQPFQFDPQALLISHTRLIAAIAITSDQKLISDPRREAGISNIAMPAQEASRAAMEVTDRRFPFIPREVLSYYGEKMLEGWLPTFIDQKLSTEDLMDFDPEAMKFAVIALLTDVLRRLHQSIMPSQTALSGEWVIVWGKSVATAAGLDAELADMMAEPLESKWTQLPSPAMSYLARPLKIDPMMLLVIHREMVDGLVEDLNARSRRDATTPRKAPPPLPPLAPRQPMTDGIAPPHAEVPRDLSHEPPHESPRDVLPDQPLDLSDVRSPSPAPPPGSGKTPLCSEIMLGKHLRQPFAVVLRAAAQVSSDKFKLLNWSALRRYATLFIEDWLCSAVAFEVTPAQLVKITAAQARAIAFAFLADFLRRHSAALTPERPAEMPRWKWVELWINTVGEAAAIDVDTIMNLIDPLSDDEGQPTEISLELFESLMLSPFEIIRQHLRIADQVAANPHAP